MKRHIAWALGLTASLALAAAPGALLAETLHFAAHLTGAQETPPNTSPGTGEATLALDTDTRLAIWSVEYRGLGGPATMAHIHGPAPAGVAAGVVLPLAPPQSPIHGSAVMSPEQVVQLRAGQDYVNVHTAAHPGGEIRGQLEAVH